MATESKKSLIPRKDFFISISLHNDIPRSQLERKPDDPGDGFLYRLSFGLTDARSEMRWVEVTEVFARDDAKQVDEVIRRRNDIKSSRTIDVSEFERNIDPRRPPKALQRRTADKVIEAVRKKLNKTSYREVSGEHGSGCLVVGLPLWYATWPLDPNRWANVLDDFCTRVVFGLQEIQRELLDEKDCPFDRVVVVWEISWPALEDYIERCDHAAYSNPAILRLDNPLPPLALVRIVWESRERSLMPLFCCTLFCNATKKPGWKAKRKQKNNKPPALEVITLLEGMVGDFESEQKGKGFSERVKTRFAVLFLKVFCFFRAHGRSGLEQWLIARLSPLAHVQRMGAELAAKSTVSGEHKEETGEKCSHQYLRSIRTGGIVSRSCPRSMSGAVMEPGRPSNGSNRHQPLESQTGWPRASVRSAGRNRKYGSAAALLKLNAFQHQVNRPPTRAIFSSKERLRKHG